MFNPDFYPTPKNVIIEMLEGTIIKDKVVLEPSAGKGDIIDHLSAEGAKEVLFCEIEKDLRTISQEKAKFLKADFLSVESSDISHIDLIVMNPPFSKDTQHILHAYNIAPEGCKIIALCNSQTILNPYSMSRKELKQNIDLYGNFKNLGDCFLNSERSTGVEVGLITLNKPGNNNSSEFEGFYLEEEEEPQGEGIMSYNVVRDLVQRYIGSIKIFDKQLEQAQKMNALTSGYFSVDIGMNITNEKAPITRAEFKKAMQKSGWSFIFNKMNMQKYATRGLREDINKFVEEQTEIPFTMRNIYKMLEIVVGTTEQRMDKAILEVFDKITLHYHENRHNLEGWKTNSHYLLNKKFIAPDICWQDPKWYKGKSEVQVSWHSSTEKIEDLLKALCYITGSNYDDFNSLRDVATDQHYGNWFDWAFFKCKAFKKGTMHFEFKDEKIWALFNQRVAKIKGFPLYEKAPDKRTERQKKAAEPTTPRTTAKVLHTFKVSPTLF